MKITKERVRDFYRDFADAYDITRFGFLKDHIINALQLEDIHSILKNTDVCISLDAGCGSGRITRVLVRKSQVTVAMDANVTMLRQAMRKICSSHQSEFVVGDVEHLPFRKNYFDVVTCFRVMWHMSNPLKSIAELVGVTKTGGLLLIDIMNRYSLFNLYSSVFKKKDVLTKSSCLREIVKFLISNGTEIVEMKGVRSPIIQLFPRKISRSHKKLAKLVYLLECFPKRGLLRQLCTQTMICARKVRV